ncbi:MAG: carboxypeptidase regulatory-like domain-containing protein [Acidobacteriota bacterium]
MSKSVITTPIVAAVLVFAPTLAFAQASVTGTVRDTSGAVLPGVTVEATSAALIEKARTVVTDGTGQYRIVDLQPGRYNVSFALQGFATVVREGIELAGSFTAAVNVELRVGTISETVTIRGETPIVDVQSAVRQDVIRGSLIAELPTARNVQNVAILIPGMAVTGTLDVGGLRGGAEVNNFSAHGGRNDDGRLLVDGMNVGGPTGGAGANSGGGGTSYFQPDMGNAAELAVTTSGALGEAESGGPVINVIPRSGGNTPNGAFFFNFANGGMQGSNLTDALKAQGSRVATEDLITTHDVTGSFGGPIKKDRLWFFWSGRTKATEKKVPVMLYNKNAGTASWLFEADESRPAFNDSTTNATNLRVTWQATSRQKVNLYVDEQTLKDNHKGGGSATTSPEAAGTSDAYPQHLVQVGWQSPATQRLLLDVAFSTSAYDYGGRERDGNLTRDLVRVTDTGIQSGIQSVTYRSMNWQENHASVPRWKASAAYVTGAHNFKVGYTGFVQVQDNRNFTNTRDISYTFRNGVPQSLTMVGANPIQYRSRAFSQSAYVQEQWTLGRLTLQAAARYDNATSIYPGQTFGGSRFHPAVFDFPTDTEGGITGFHDINPRVGVTYDLSGDGKTSVKFNAGRYTDSASSDGRWTLGNPLSRIQTTVGRSWADSNGNFVPDCDLLNPASQNLSASGRDVCGAWNNNTFGTQVFSTTYDPDMFKGWYTRPMDWELGASVQRQILSGMSVEVGWHRRWIDKWTLIKNTLNAPSDFDVYSITAPVDPALGVASGRVIGDLWNVSPQKFGQINNQTILEDNIPGIDRKNWWNGVDLNVNARFKSGLTLRGGAVLSTAGDDWCTYVENGYYGTGIPEGPSRRNCRTVTPVLSEYKGLGTYTIPRIDVQVAGTLTSRNGPAKSAVLQVPATEIAQTLGRAPSGSVQTIGINLFETNESFFDQITIVDLRVGKIVKFGRRRLNVGVDIYNALNSSTGQTFSTTYSVTTPALWGQPTQILPARFAKIGVQFDF